MKTRDTGAPPRTLPGASPLDSTGGMIPPDPGNENRSSVLPCEEDRGASCPPAAGGIFSAALPKALLDQLHALASAAATPREAAVDVMYALQHHYGYLCDAAMEDASRLLGLTTLELESLATFYDYLYRRPVGRYVIHVCDSVVCWMLHQDSLFDYLCRTLGVPPGGTTEDGLFTVLPSACVGNCHNAPTMLINGKFYNRLTPKRVDAVIAALRAGTEEPVKCK